MLMRLGAVGVPINISLLCHQLHMTLSGGVGGDGSADAPGSVGLSEPQALQGPALLSFSDVDLLGTQRSRRFGCFAGRRILASSVRPVWPRHHHRPDRHARMSGIPADDPALGHAEGGDCRGVSRSRMNCARWRRRRALTGPAVVSSTPIFSSIRGSATESGSSGRSR